MHASLSFDYQSVICPKKVKVHPSLSTLAEKTHSRLLQEKKCRNLLRQKGMPIDHMDLFVASVAIYNNLTLVSHNTKHFARINNLKLTDWQ